MCEETIRKWAYRQEKSNWCNFSSYNGYGSPSGICASEPPVLEKPLSPLITLEVSGEHTWITFSHIDIGFLLSSSAQYDAEESLLPSDYL